MLITLYLTIAALERGQGRGELKQLYHMLSSIDWAIGSMVMLHMGFMNENDSVPRAALAYEKASELLSRYGGNAPWTRHCRAVALVAARAAEMLSERCDIDREFLRVAGLVHDIGRYRTHDPVQHGVEGFRLLSSLGHHREAFVCASHIQCGLSAAEAALAGLPEQDFLPRTLEEKLIPVLDSIVELDRPTTVDQRFASLARRYQGNAAFLDSVDRSHRRVRTMLHEVAERYGLSLEQIAFEALR